MSPSRRNLWLIFVAAVTGFSICAQSADQQVVIHMLRSAGDAIKAGDAASAEDLFKKVIVVAPNLSDGYLGLGMVQLREGKPNEAIHQLLRATELNPKLSGAHLFLGIAQYQIGEADTAIASLQTETALQPSNSEAFLWLGIMELNRNQPNLATGPLDTARALDPKEPSILYYSGRAHMLVAENDYRRLNELAPNSAFVHRALAEEFDRGGEPERAIAEYESAIRQEPNNPDLYESLGEANLKMSRSEAAQQAYEQALKLNSNSAIALYNLGKLDVERGKPEQGVAILRKAEALHASPAPTEFYLGLGLEELGKNAEAAQCLERSIASQPSAFIEQSAYYQLVRVYQRLNRKADAQRALVELTKLKAEAAKANTQAGDIQVSPPAVPLKPTEQDPQKPGI